MAKDFGLGRQTGLGSLIDAYYSGVDRRHEKEDRDRKWGVTNLNLDYRQATEDPYNRVRRDEAGVPRGLEENIEWQQRDELPASTRFPEMFREPNKAPAMPDRNGNPAPAPAAPAPKAPVDYTSENQEKTPTGRPIGRTYEDGARAPQSNAPGRNDQAEPGKPEMGPNDPKPLLRDPKAAQAADQNRAQMAQNAVQHEDNLAAQEREGNADREARGKIEERKLGQTGTRAFVGAGTSSVEYDPNDPGQPGVDPEGRPVRVRNATKTTQEFDRGADVLGGADAGSSEVIPGAVRPTAQGGESPARLYNPSPYMRKRITDAATTVPRYSQVQQVSLASLPKALRDRMGIPDDSKETMPSDLLKAWLTGSLKPSPQDKSLPPEALPFVEDVEAGTMDPGEGLSAFNTAYPEVPITPEVANAFYKGKGIQLRGKGQEDAAKRAEGVNNRIRDTKISGFVATAVKDTYKAFTGFLEQSGSARSAKALANSGDTKGTVRAIQTMLARASGEKGALSNDDVKGYGGGEGYFDRLDQFFQSKLDGEGLTPENVKIINNLTDEFLRAAKRKADSEFGAIIKGLRTNVRGYNGNPDEVEAMFREEMGPDSLLTGFAAQGAPAGKRAPAPQAAAPAAKAPKMTPEQVEAMYQQGLQAAQKITDPVKRRAAIQKMAERKQQMLKGAANGP